MNKIVNSILVVGSLALLGGACYKAADTNVNVAGNTNVVESNTNALVNTNTEINTNVSNTNVGVNTNSSTIDTSDWVIYTNEEAGLSFRYPQDWKLAQTQEGDDSTELLDNNDDYDHQLVNIYVHWSSRHEDIVYESGLVDPPLDQWLSCEYIYDEQTECGTVVVDGINVLKREGEVEPPFGDDYVALAFERNNFTVVIDARSLLREISANESGNLNLDGLDYIDAVLATVTIAD